SKFFKISFVFPFNQKSLNVDKIKGFFDNYNIDVHPFFQDTKSDLKYLLKNPFKKIPFKWDKYYNPRAQELINSIIDKNDIKYLWVSTPHMARYALESKKKFTNIKLFLREHNIEYKLVEQFLHMSKNPIYKVIAYWQMKKSKALEKEYWQYFDKIFFISDLDYEIAVNEAPELEEKFVVLYDGHELVVKDPVMSASSDFIYMANFKSIQNVISFKWFIEKIWKPNLLKLKNLNIKLYITGSSEIDVLRIIKPLKLQDLNIVNLGFVDDIGKVVLRFKYVLSPTVIGSGIRLKLLNGMACGKPVFVTPLDISTCKVFKDLDNVILFSNAEDFMEKLLVLENNIDLYVNICKRAIRTISEGFSWEDYSKKATKIILNL
ncbi:MAG: glycosyltransferase, partial [Nitrososphaeria archaeon]